MVRTDRLGVTSAFKKDKVLRGLINEHCSNFGWMEIIIGHHAFIIIHGVSINALAKNKIIKNVLVAYRGTSPHIIYPLYYIRILDGQGNSNPSGNRFSVFPAWSHHLTRRCHLSNSAHPLHKWYRRQINISPACWRPSNIECREIHSTSHCKNIRCLKPIQKNESDVSL